MIYVKDSVHYTRRNDLKPLIIKCIWIEIQLKGIYLSKALTCMNFFLYKQKCFLSRRRIPLGTLLYEHFIHLTKITFRPNIQLLSNPRHAYQYF